MNRPEEIIIAFRNVHGGAWEKLHPYVTNLENENRLLKEKYQRLKAVHLLSMEMWREEDKT